MNEQLKKEVESLLKQGYNESQIKQAMTEKGYALNEISDAIKNHIDIKYTKKKNFKPLIIISFVFAIILIIGLTYIFWPKEIIPVENIKPFSDYAGDWIGNINNSIIINVSEATSDMSEFNYGRQTFIDTDGKIYAIFMNPYFEGQSVKSIFENTGKIPIISGTNFNLTDDTPQAFALIKREDGDFVLYLFVDEDFRNKFNNEIYIIWNDDVSNSSLANERLFDFSKKENGVYFDKIKNAKWMTDNPINGRVYLGNLRKQDLINEYYNKTFFEIY